MALNYMNKESLLIHDLYEGIDMKGKDIITLHDLTTDEIFKILKTTDILNLKYFIGC